MERAKKLMARTKLNSDDRFSDLPAEIVHHILSHLPMKDVARLSAVSKRCQELCFSNPTLSFCTPRTRSKSTRRRFYDSLDSLLHRRRLQDMKTERFRLHCLFRQETFEEEENRVNMCLQIVVNSGVEDICLEMFNRRKAFSFPLLVLSCKSLRSLKIIAHYEPLRLPSSLSIPSFADRLQVFVLKGLHTDNESLGEWFSSFKCLRVLKLDGVRGIKAITITNSSVETLIIASDRDLLKLDIQKVTKLRYLFIKGYDYQSIKISAPSLRSLSIIWATFSHKTLEICATNLQRFQWFGDVVDDYCMENSPNLSYASVGLLPREKPRAPHASVKHSLKKVLHSIRGAKSLTLWNDFLRVLYVHGCLPFLFDNLEHLAIRGTLSCSRVQLLSFLLMGVTNLKHLILIKNKARKTRLFYSMKYEQSQNLPFTHLLKTTAVEFFNGRNEVKQIQHVLKNGEDLGMMAILSTSPISQDFITKFKEFIIPSHEDY